MAESVFSPGVEQREVDKSFITPAPPEIGAAIIGPSPRGPVERPTVVGSYLEYTTIFGTTFQTGSNEEEYFTSMAAKNYFNQGGNSLLVTRVVPTTENFLPGVSTPISSSLTPHPSFTIETLGEGALYNNPIVNENTDGTLPEGTEDNIRWEITEVDESRGTFNLIVRRGDDSRKSKIILEEFRNVSLDPNSTDYISKRIGDQYTFLDASEGYIRTVGEYPNNSRYIRVSSVKKKTLNYLENDGVTIGTDSLGTSYSGSLPVETSGGFENASGENLGKNMYDAINSTSTQGLVQTDYDDIINILNNSEEYQFNIISAPGLLANEHTDAVNKLISLAESRKDCIAVVDTVTAQSTISATVSSAKTLNSSYAATYWPWVQLKSATGKNVWAPASTVIPGIYAFTDNSSAPWFAPAGLTRGGVPGVIQVERKLTKPNRGTLYEGKVNPIATFPRQGITVFGQKTLQNQATALNRVNVRRLLIELKRFIGDVARTLTFDQNTTALRNKFTSRVNPYLESVFEGEGLYSYEVTMDESNNSGDVIDRNEVRGRIVIQPTKTGEYILLDYQIDPTGATFE